MSTMQATIKERPILFSGAMVRAILEGRKTQTRRVIKDMPPWVERVGPANGDQVQVFGADGMNWRRCPYGAPGDRLWIRETWMAEHFPSAPDKPYIHYRADNTGAGSGWTAARMWKPSIHMPRWASRITLEVTGVRVERVQDITEPDAEAEGIPPWDGDPDGTVPRLGFARLWNEINASRGYGWQTNPWVWRIEFRRVQP